jgi:Wzt C-terminal domain/Sulfotransferase family
MNTHLIYLHIEKSAGSAQRLLFYTTVGNEHVYWYGVPNEQSTKTMYDYFIVGGHQSITFYENKKLIFTAVVRNPVERVLSFYNYCKEVIPHFWVPLGLDASSLKNTVKFCTEFRSAINNLQCQYLCGSTRYDDAIDSILKREFLVGCIEDVDAFNSHIARHLDLVYRELPLDNIGRQDYVNDIELDAETLSEIKSLVSEDEKLYKFISQDCKGLYSSVSNTRWEAARVALRNLRASSEASGEVKISEIAEKRIFTNFSLISAALGERTTIQSGETLNLALEFSVERTVESIEVGIHILDISKRLVYCTNSTMLGHKISSLGPGLHKANYSIIADLPEGQYTVGYTFTECSAGDYQELNQCNDALTFQVTVLRMNSSVGYASLRCEFDCRPASDEMTCLIEDATGEVVIDGALGDLIADEVFDLPVRLKNASTQAWESTDQYEIKLSYHWEDQNGNMVLFEGIRTPLPVQKIPIDETISALVRIAAPATCGRYRLILMVMQEKWCWLDQKGFTPARLELNVVTSDQIHHYPATDIRFASNTGQREGSELVSTGREGLLLYGPYAQLPAGRYVARFYGQCDADAKGGWVDACFDKGGTVLTRVELGDSFKPGVIAELPFEIAQPVKDLEVRLWMPAKATARVKSLSIEPYTASKPKKTKQ